MTLKKKTSNFTNSTSVLRAAFKIELTCKNAKKALLKKISFSGLKFDENIMKGLGQGKASLKSCQPSFGRSFYTRVSVGEYKRRAKVMKLIKRMKRFDVAQFARLVL